MTTPGLDGGKIQLKVVADASDLDRDLGKKVRGTLSKVERQAGDSGKRVGAGFSRGAGSALGPLKALGAAAAGAFAGAAVVAGIKSVVSAASDYAETVSKVRTIFGEASGSIEEFGRKSAQSLGISNTAALDAVSTFGGLFKTLGDTNKQAAAKGQNFTKLAADLASFHNTSPEEAIVALGSALRGEAEPIRKYNVLLNDASIKAEAFASGITKNVKQSLTPAQKAQATYNLILKQTKVAQGDVARTSSGLANTQRRLSAKVTDLKANLGKALLPAALAAAGGLERIIGSGKKLRPFLDKLKSNIAALVQAFKFGNSNTDTGVKGAFEKVGNAARVLAPILAKLAGFVRDQLVAAFRLALPILQALGTFILNNIIPAVVSFAQFLDRNSTAIKGVIFAIAAGVAAFKIYRGILAIVRTAVLAFRVANFLLALSFNTLKAAIIANPIGLLIAALAAVAVGLVYAYKHSEKFRGIVNAVFKAVGGVVLNFVDKFLEGLGQIFHVLGKLPGKFGAPFRAAEKGIKGARDKVHDLQGSLEDLGKPVTIKVDLEAQQAKRDALALRKAILGDVTLTATAKHNILKAEGAGATGAVVRRPTVALIGEAGPEAVVPLSRTRGNGPLPTGAAVTQQFYVSRETPPDALMRAAAFRYRHAAG